MADRKRGLNIGRVELDVSSTSAHQIKCSWKAGENILGTRKVIDLETLIELGIVISWETWSLRGHWGIKHASHSFIGIFIFSEIFNLPNDYYVIVEFMH